MKIKILKRLIPTISLGLTLLATFELRAQEVVQVKSGKALLNLSGAPASAGTEFFSINAEGKRKAILRIRQVKGDRAIADVVKGTAEPGHTLQMRGGGGSSAPARTQEVTTAPAAEPKEERRQRPRGFLGRMLKRGTGVGILGGLAQNSMSLTAKKSGVSEDLSLAGNSFNLMGFYDYDLSKSFTVRARAGLETFSAKGTAKNAVVCSNSTSCDVGFNYLSGEAAAHFNFMQGKTRAWAGAGFAFMFVMTKSSSISNLDTSNATNNMMYLSTGADFDMGRGAFVPVSFDYGLFPGSAGVNANSMILRAGYGWRY